MTGPAMNSVEIAYRAFRASLNIGPSPPDTDLEPERAPEPTGRHYRGHHRSVAPGRDHPPQMKQAKVNEDAKPRPGEIQLKEFLLNEAEKKNSSAEYIRQLIKRGKYPGLQIRRVSATIVFVK